MSPSNTLRVLVALVLCGAAGAQGVLIPEVAPDVETATPPFVIESTTAEIEIGKAIATVHVEMVFRNPGPREVEGIFVFPVPVGTALQDFTLTAGGKVMESQILPAEEARRLYESIVNRRQDPGLLEFVDQACVRARIFPIPPGGTQKIDLSYANVAVRDGDVVRWTYPLRALRYAAPPANGVSIAIKIAEDEPIRAVYSPTHEVLVAREGDRVAHVEYAPENAYLEDDLLLYYTLSPKKVGVSILSHQSGEDDPFFTILAAPSVDGLEALPKDVVFVLDTSGSMRGDKWTQASGAIESCLARLAPADRLGLVCFSTDVRVLSGELVEASPTAIDEASGFISTQRVNGGTALDGAIGKAFEILATRGETNGREGFVVLVTDGLPTIGERDPNKVITSLAGKAPAGVRLFGFGVGYDVDAQLIDRIAADQGGTTDYIHPGEAIDDRVEAFFRKVESPVLTDLSLEIEGLRTRDVHPKELMPLFAGGQLVVFGRAVGTGPITVRLRGKVRGEERVFEASHEIRTNRTDHAFLPALWATRKIGYLLDQVRLHGKSDEVVDEIIRLSKKYGVLTEYTSFFADEAGLSDTTALRQSLESNLARANAVRGENWGVNQALNLRNYRDVACNSQINFLYGSAGANQYRAANVRRIGDKVFYLRGDTWYDAAFDGKMDVDEVDSFSEAYWTLNQEDAEMARYQSLGRKVVIVKEGRALHCR